MLFCSFCYFVLMGGDYTVGCCYKVITFVLNKQRNTEDSPRVDVPSGLHGYVPLAGYQNLYLPWHGFNFAKAPTNIRISHIERVNASAGLDSASDCLISSPRSRTIQAINSRAFVPFGDLSLWQSFCDGRCEAG